MKNFNLNSLEKFDNVPFTRATALRYATPIKELVERNHLPLRLLDFVYDNASMVRIDLEPTMNDVNLGKYLNSFDSLKGMHQKMFTKINGFYLSVYIPKMDTDRQILSFRTLLESEDYQEVFDNGELPFVLGETVENKVIIQDLAELPHLLIAGLTGTGKSVTVHTLIGSLLYNHTPETLQFDFIDMKMTELSPYSDIPHLAHPVCIEPEEAEELLKEVVKEMQSRLNLMMKARVFTLSRYNKLPNVAKIPYRVLIIDEYADLISNNKDVEKSLISIAQKGRAAGIHLVLATQRPDANVVTGQIKSNIQARVALTVTDSVNSRIIIDENGAELLNKKGDMIFKSGDGTFRLQGAYLSENDVKYIVSSVCGKYGTNNFMKVVEEPQTQEEEFIPEFKSNKRVLDGDIKDNKLVLRDEFYQTCTAIIENGKASRIFIKRLWNCGDKKADRYLERMEKLGIIAKYDEKELKYPLLINADDFNNNFMSEGVANG